MSSFKIILQKKSRDSQPSTLKKCTNPETLSAFNSHNKNAATSQDNRPRVGRNNTKKSSKKAGAHQRSCRMNILLEKDFDKIPKNIKEVEKITINEKRNQINNCY
jgi:hypothetical protein